MSLIEAMQKRRSIRKYTDEKIDDAVIENILRAGMLAESGKAIRPWEFIVVRDRGMLDKMAKCRVGAAKMLEGADCAILVIADPAATDVWIEDCSVVMNPHSLVTTHRQEKVGSENGLFVPDDVYSKLCVIERHGKTGEISAAPVKGFGIVNGAVATSVAHDSHNIIAAGDNDGDIIEAVEELRNMQGGYVIASGGRIAGRLPLPVCGLMTDKPCSEVEDTVRDMLDTAHNMGVSRDIDPFITLSFMALTVIPELRLTERGLFDVNEMSYLNA